MVQLVPPTSMKAPVQYGLEFSKQSVDKSEFVPATGELILRGDVLVA